MNPSISAIYKKEIKLFFNTPVAFIATIIFLVFVGWFFTSNLFLANAATMRTMFEITPFAFLFFIPALTMKLFSEELKSGTYDLLISKPVSTGEILWGKFFATLSVSGVFLIPTFLYAITLGSLSNLDWGPVIGGYLGLMLFAAVYISIGIFASTLTENQIVAFITGFILCFFFYICDKMSIYFPGFLGGFVQYLSVDFHYNSISRGVIDTKDLIYAVSMVFVFHFLSRLTLLRRKAN